MIESDTVLKTGLTNENICTLLILPSMLGKVIGYHKQQL
jgi:hypothetical protein